MLLLLFVLVCLLGAAFATGQLDFIFKPVVGPLSDNAIGQMPTVAWVEAHEWEFDAPGTIKEWDQKTFNGRTDHEIVDAGGSEKALRIRSHSGASALYKKVDIDIATKPQLSWRWRANVFPPTKPVDAEKKTEFDDYVGRVYVIFKGRSIFSADIIEYTWDNSLPEDTSFVSPFSERAKMFVVQSGPSPEDGSWVAERRDIASDYQRLFGKKPEHDIAAIALMSDSDNMKSETELLIQRISIKVQPKGEKRSSK